MKREKSMNRTIDRNKVAKIHPIHISTRLKSDRFIRLALAHRQIETERTSSSKRNKRKKFWPLPKKKKKIRCFFCVLMFASSFFIYIFFVQIQNNKQIASSLKAKNSNRTTTAAAQLSPAGAIAAQRIMSRWTNDEYQLAIKGMQMHGKDFQAIAELLGTKNESHVSQFYTTNRKKYNLDDILKEFEAKQQQKQQKQQHQQQQKQKMNDAQQKMAISSSSTDTKANIKKHIPDDDIMEVSKSRRNGS